MNDIIIAIIGALATIITAIISGNFAKKQTIVEDGKLTVEEKKALLQKRSGKFIRFITFVAVFFVGIIAAVSFISVQKKWQIKSESDKISADFNQLIVKGISKTEGNPYVMPSVIMLISLESIGKDTSAHIEADYDIVYNTIYVKDVKENGKAFDDGFRSNRNGTVIKCQGSDKEIVYAESETSKAWNDYFPAIKGNMRATVSHFKVVYPKKLKEFDSKFFGRLNINEEEFSYPNTSDDVIGELVIMIKSSTLNLKIAGIHDAATGSLDDLNPSGWINPQVFNTSTPGVNSNVIIARYKNIGNRDVAKLKVSW